MEENAAPGFKPPYLPFKTFWSFLQELGTKPIPPSLDRSMLRSKSGTDQANLLAALKSFGLVSDTLAVDSALEPFAQAAVNDEPSAKRTLESLLRLHYKRQFDLSDQNATEKSLVDSFEEDFEVTGDTKRKAVTFFLQAVRFAGISLSPHFPMTRGGGGRPAGARTKSTARRKPAGTPLGTGTRGGGGPTPGERITVTIPDVGTVTLIVDVRWLELEDTTFTQLRQMVKDLRALGQEYEMEEETT